MSKRYLKEMNETELKALYNSCEKIRRDMWDLTIQGADFWAGEVLDYFKGIRRGYLDYDIGYCGCHFKVEPEAVGEFLECCEKLNHDMEVIYDTTRADDPLRARMERMKARVDVYLDSRYGYEDMSDENFERLETWITDGLEMIIDKLLDYFRSDYNAADDDNHCASYFIERVHDGEYDDYYLDTEEGALYEDVGAELIERNVSIAA